MNENDVLIMKYSEKNHKWVDVTYDVAWYKNDNTSWKILFKNNSQYYHMSYTKLKIFDKPKEINFVEVFYNGSPCYNVKKILLFNGKIYKIFYDNFYSIVAFENEIKVIKDVLKSDKKTTNVMEYYRRVVSELSQDEENMFLAEQFNNIDYVDEESVLSLYLKGKLGKTNYKLKHPLISPFGTNFSQSKALKMMFSNRISIVEGPPGTGKTQTILNFIANAVINDMSIAVVSNNNSATNNVYEKLEKRGYSFLAAKLGNIDNVEDFFANYKSEIPTLPNEKVSRSTIEQLNISLPFLYEKENTKKKLIRDLDDLKLEYKHFLCDNSNTNFSYIKFNPKNISSRKILSLLAYVKEKYKKISFIRKIYIMIILKVNKKLLLLEDSEIALYLNKFYYEAKIYEIEEELRLINKKYSKSTLEQKTNDYVNLSKKYFDYNLSSRYSYEREDVYKIENYKCLFKNFIKDYPIVLSSTYSLAKCSGKGFLFDYLIIDESSQVNMASAILSLRVAKNVVIVGDIKQLPQIDDKSFKDINEKLLKECKISKSYSYYGNSIMSSLLTLYKDIPKTMLIEHYRCSPDIIGFCNKRFYDNKLIIYTEKKEEYSMKVIKTVPGNFARINPHGTGIYNQREIDEIKGLINRENFDDLGIIVPYKYQSLLIMEQLPDYAETSTIHKFQGREKDNIIFSTVANDINNFVADDNLVNVAVSRAKSKFILITSDKMFKSENNVVSDLVNYISYKNNFGQLEEGKIKSVYDILYSDYNDALTKFRMKHPSKEYDTENITKVLLENILSNDRYSNYWFVMHVSLKNVITPKNIELTSEEFKFFNNPKSHIDFLIYNKTSHRPVLAIEVDGVSYHEQNSKQSERDQKKNSILYKCGLNLLRLKTNECNEKERIIAELESIINYKQLILNTDEH